MNRKESPRRQNRKTKQPLASSQPKRPSKRDSAKTRSPHLLRLDQSHEEAELEKIFECGLPSHGSARHDARNTVLTSGLSLAKTSKEMSQALSKTISAEELAAQLRKKQVPLIQIIYDDPLIDIPDAGDFKDPSLPPLARIKCDYYEIAKHFPDILYGTTTEDTFMLPWDVEEVERCRQYAGLTKSRRWQRFKNGL
jgi:hypothetical protein